MPTYQYGCARDGMFEERLPMGTAPPTSSCPACNAQSARVFSAPLLATRAKEALALIEATERTASEPDVVTALPRSRSGPARSSSARNPAVARLPRP